MWNEGLLLKLQGQRLLCVCVEGNFCFKMRIAKSKGNTLQQRNYLGVDSIKKASEVWGLFGVVEGREWWEGYLMPWLGF